MKNDLISVVVPVYNVEKYLDKCINSILNQSYSKLEIILINDGSTDSSGKICDEYKKKDKRIKVKHKKNGGLSDARNVGIQIATGKYITFLASDDYIDDDYVEYLYYLIKKYKVGLSFCKCHIERGHPTKDKKTISKDEKCDKIKAFEEILYAKDFEVSACGKLYLRSQFKNILFPIGKLFEDNATTYKLIDQNEKVALGFCEKYHYVMRSNSITKRKFTSGHYYLIEASDEMCDYLKKYPELKNAILRKRCIARISTLNRLLDSAEFNYNSALKLKYEVLQYKNVLFDNKASFRDRISILCLFCGIKFYKLCWNLYKKITGRN